MRRALLVAGAVATVIGVSTVSPASPSADPGAHHPLTMAVYGAPTTSSAQSTEIAERTGADLRWLYRAFAQAQEDQSKSVMILTQADMWDLDGKTPAHPTGYDPFMSSIASHTTDLGKPVLLINGDSHIYRSDNPLSPTATFTIEVTAEKRRARPSRMFAPATTCRTSTASWSTATRSRWNG
jgi:hypothetical protein